MSIFKNKYSLGLLCAAVVGGAPHAALAQTNSAPQVPTGGNPNNYWNVQITGDYFHYDAAYNRDDYSSAGGNTSASGRQSGNLYGITLSTKFPFMQPDEGLDISLREGKLSGDYPQSEGGGAYGEAADTTHLLQGQLLYRMGIVNRKSEDPKFKLDMLLGLDLQQWNSTEITPPGFVWSGSTATLRLEHRTMGLIDFGMGANWYAWTHWNADHNKRFRIGLRGEALLGLGGLSDSATYASSYTDFAVSGEGKAVVYTDYKFGNFTAVLEGGYAYTEYWFVGGSSSSAVTTINTESQSLYGPYVRLGIGYSW